MAFAPSGRAWKTTRNPGRCPGLGAGPPSASPVAPSGRSHTARPSASHRGTPAHRRASQKGLQAPRLARFFDDQRSRQNPEGVASSQPGVERPKDASPRVGRSAADTPPKGAKAVTEAQLPWLLPLRGALGKPPATQGVALGWEQARLRRARLPLRGAAIRPGQALPIEAPLPIGARPRFTPRPLHPETIKHKP